LHFRIY